MAQTKFTTEKILHELIRDLPEVERANRNYERGLITFDSFLENVARAYREEREKAS